jgi:hypothetical protein
MLRQAAREHKGRGWTAEQISRDDWPRAWRWIGPVFGDLRPHQVEPEMLIGTDPNNLGLRPQVAKCVSESEAHRVIKVWRLLWSRMSVLGYCDAERDPSFTFQNSAPDPRNAIWYEGEVVRIVKDAWRRGYKGLAVCIAVSWDSQLSPVDARHLTMRQCKHTKSGCYFAVERAKTGKPAVATLSRRTERLLGAYLEYLNGQKVELLETASIFRTRGGAPVSRPGKLGELGGDRGGGRAWMPVPYTKDRLGRDFRYVRTAVFGPEETRQIQDMRRSGTIEAFAGGADPEDVSEKLANTLASSSRLQKTYNPVHFAKVRQVDVARRRGRNLLLEQNEAKSVNSPEQTVSTPDPKTGVSD